MISSRLFFRCLAISAWFAAALTFTGFCFVSRHSGLLQLERGLLWGSLLCLATGVVAALCAVKSGGDVVSTGVVESDDLERRGLTGSNNPPPYGSVGHIGVLRLHFPDGNSSVFRFSQKQLFVSVRNFVANRLGVSPDDIILFGLGSDQLFVDGDQIAAAGATDIAVSFVATADQLNERRFVEVYGAHCRQIVNLYSQQHRMPGPTITYHQINLTPPKFGCRIVFLGRTKRGFGPSKQLALALTSLAMVKEMESFALGDIDYDYLSLALRADARYIGFFGITEIHLEELYCQDGFQFRFTFRRNGSATHVDGPVRLSKAEAREDAAFNLLGADTMHWVSRIVVDDWDDLPSN